MTHYLYVTDRPWALEAFAAARPRLPGEWSVITAPGDLEAALDRAPVRYAFFPHWSHIVPERVLDRVECVCFHMTDLPYGRGGSPLQNLIQRGHRQTRLTALRMTPVLDGGPVYAKADLALDGSAAQIFARMAQVSLGLMEAIVRDTPEPVPQPAPDPAAGTAESFRRRRPAESVLPQGAGAAALYDHIRMLDAPGYPPAFLDHGDVRLTFSDAELRPDDSVAARVVIRPGASDGAVE